jgi:hypothetical protein
MGHITSTQVLVFGLLFIGLGTALLLGFLFWPTKGRQ